MKIKTKRFKFWIEKHWSYGIWFYVLVHPSSPGGICGTRWISPLCIEIGIQFLYWSIGVSWTHIK